MLKRVPHVVSGALPDDLGRTEDARFSPSGRLLALVATQGCILLFAVDVRSRPIRVERHTLLRSTSLGHPHGIDFLSEDVVVVANRSGHVTFYRLPPMDAWEDRMAVKPIHHMKSVWFGRDGLTRKVSGRNVRCGPGSVRVHGGELYVCCNNSSTVTTHPYRMTQEAIETHDGSVVAQEGLELADGVALSRDGRWMAISDHDHHRLVVYRRADLAQSCVLRDPELVFPHGLCFDPTGRRLYVADSGGRYVHVFESGGQWDEPAESCAFKLLAVDEDAFRKTQETVKEDLRALEGGVKGIDLDPSGRVVATTCRNQGLRFFEAEIPWSRGGDGTMAPDPATPAAFLHRERS